MLARAMGWRAIGAWVLVAFALAGCARIDQDQVRLCRIALPALEPAETRITVRRVGAVERGVRIDYEAARAGSPALARFAECRFALGRRHTVEAITTDRGEVPGATVFLLRRHYIETPEGAAADPGPGEPESDLPSWAMPAATLFFVLAFAIIMRLLGRSAPNRRR